MTVRSPVGVLQLRPIKELVPCLIPGQHMGQGMLANRSSYLQNFDLCNGLPRICRGPLTGIKDAGFNLLSQSHLH